MLLCARPVRANCPPLLTSVRTVEQPVTYRQKATTSGFEVEVIGAIRGDEAWDMLQSANRYNDPPGPNIEYALVKVRVKNISADDYLIEVGNDAFRSVGERRVIWETPNARLGPQQFGAILYPGGVHEGWIVLQAAISERNLVVVYDSPSTPRSTQRRYLALP